jgi:hypothetical protein
VMRRPLAALLFWCMIRRHVCAVCCAVCCADCCADC